jgi:hypothetical protein
LRQRLRLVVIGDVRAAVEDPGVALGDGAVERHEFRVEIAGRLRLVQIPTMSPADSEMMSPGDTR